MLRPWFESRHARFAVPHLRSEHARGRGDHRESYGFAQSRHARAGKLPGIADQGLEFDSTEALILENALTMVGVGTIADSLYVTRRGPSNP